MNLKEFVNLNKLPISKLGSTKFKTNITGEVWLTPHKEMNRALTIFLNRPFVNSGIRQIVSFKLGKDLRFECSDEEGKDFANNWLRNRRWMKKEIKKYSVLREVCGNSYTEDVYDTNNKYNGFTTYPDPSRIYINTEFKDINKDYWVVEVPFGIKKINGKSPKYYKVNYIFGSALWQNSVYGIGYGKNHFSHDKIGLSLGGIYGRSYMASTIDDEEAMMQIIKNTAIIAKYRAMNNKFITPATDDGDLAEDDKEQLREDLLALEDGEHLIYNKKIEINSLSNQGEYDTMSNEVEFLRKDMQSGLTPNFITPWSGDTNRATAAEAKIPFETEIEQEMEEILDFLTDNIVPKLKLSYPDKLSKATDLKLVSDPIRLDGKDDLMQWSKELYAEGLITFNEARKMVGFPTVEGGDKYNWEIPQQPNTLYDDKVENFTEAMSKIPLQKFVKQFGDRYGVDRCRDAANKVVDRVDGYRIKVLKYEPGIGTPLGATGQHYIAISNDNTVIIDLTFSDHVKQLRRVKRATPWMLNNIDKKIFKKTDYMKNVYLEDE